MVFVSFILGILIVLYFVHVSKDLEKQTNVERTVILLIFFVLLAAILYVSLLAILLQGGVK